MASYDANKFCFLTRTDDFSQHCSTKLTSSCVQSPRRQLVSLLFQRHPAPISGTQLESGALCKQSSTAHCTTPRLQHSKAYFTHPHHTSQQYTALLHSALHYSTAYYDFIITAFDSILHYSTAHCTTRQRTCSFQRIFDRERPHNSELPIPESNAHRRVILAREPLVLTQLLNHTALGLDIGTVFTPALVLWVVPKP